MNIKEKSMDDIIARLKSYCKRYDIKEYGKVVSMAQGIIEAEANINPEKSYNVSEIALLLKAIRNIAWADVSGEGDG